MLNITILTHQPEYYPGPLLKGILASEHGLSYTLKWQKLKTSGLYKKPFGQEKGLCMSVQELEKQIPADNCLFIIPSPDGHPLNKKVIYKILNSKEVVFICPRYTGIDARFSQLHNVMHVSLGDYIISNGDLACIVILDSVIRILTLKHQYLGLRYDTTYSKLYAPHIYTLPRVYKGLKVPSVYLSGNKKNIDIYDKLVIMTLTLKNVYNIKTRYKKYELYRALLKRKNI